MSPDVKTQSKRPARLPPMPQPTVTAPMAPAIPLIPPRVELPPIEIQVGMEIIQIAPMMKPVVVRLAPLYSPAPVAPVPAPVPAAVPAPIAPVPVALPVPVVPTTPRRPLPLPQSPPETPAKTLPKYNCYDMETCNCKCNNPLHTRSNIALAKATKRGLLWGDMLDDWTYDE